MPPRAAGPLPASLTHPLAQAPSCCQWLGLLMCLFWSINLSSWGGLGVWADDAAPTPPFTLFHN